MNGPARFDHVMRHDLRSLTRLGEAINKPDLALHELVLLAHDLVLHAHPRAPEFVNRLYSGTRVAPIRAHCELLSSAFANLRRDFRLEEADPQFLEKAYADRGHILVRGAQPRDRLIVVFSTIFNNFGISIAALITILARTGANVLILRDPSPYCYHRGAEGLGDCIASLVQNIRALACSLEVSDIRITGFSSGGFVALLASLRLNASAYLGFSHSVDLAEGSALPPDRILTAGVRALIAPASLIDLRPLLANADPNKARWLVYGKRAAADAAHAHHLVGLPSISLVPLPDCEHNSVLHLLAEGRLAEVFMEFAKVV